MSFGTCFIAWAYSDKANIGIPCVMILSSSDSSEELLSSKSAIVDIILSAMFVYRFSAKRLIHHSAFGRLGRVRIKSAPVVRIWNKVHVGFLMTRLMYNRLEDSN